MTRSGTLRMVIVYEDFDSALRALRFLDQMAVELEPQFLINSNLWRFDALSLPELHEQAAQEAGGADMVVISTHNGAELPVHVQFWMDRWLPRKRDNSSALVAIVDQKEAPTLKGPLEDYLHRKADEGDMEFFQIRREVAAVTEFATSRIAKSSRPEIMSRFLKLPEATWITTALDPEKIRGQSVAIRLKDGQEERGRFEIEDANLKGEISVKVRYRSNPYPGTFIFTAFRVTQEMLDSWIKDKELVLDVP